MTNGEEIRGFTDEQLAVLLSGLVIKTRKDIFNELADNEDLKDAGLELEWTVSPQLSYLRELKYLKEETDHG